METALPTANSSECYEIAGGGSVVLGGSMSVIAVAPIWILQYRNTFNTATDIFTVHVTWLEGTPKKPCSGRGMVCDVAGRYARC